MRMVNNSTCPAVLLQVLSNSKGPNCIQLPMEDDVQLTLEQLDRVTGQAARPAVAVAAAPDTQSGLNFPITSSGVCCVAGQDPQPQDTAIASHAQHKHCIVGF